MAADTQTFGCNLNEEQAHLRFPEMVGNHPTFGLVESDAEWERLRNDPAMLVKGIPPGIGRIRRFERQGAQSLKLTMPDGTDVTMWSFKDENGELHFPATPIRVQGGDLAQVKLSTSKKVHTIHHHGIEPDMDNDGVGHTSFEVNGKYIYQWRAHPANAGTFFYHCHVNTTLHVQMGMFGALIIDPYEGENPPERRLPFAGAPDEWRYHADYERIWPIYSLDPVWHELGHAAGLCGEDVGLNDFNPKYFLIGDQPQDPDGSPIRGTASNPVSVTAPRGENIFLRLINATYFPVDIDFGGLPAYLIETDGRALRAGIDLDGLGATAPRALAPGQWQQRFGGAERFGVLVRGAAPGTYPITFTERHWITNEPVGSMRTEVTIT
jgi:FtsP/CotA-like multicopper oxidase with cupredoxin domain